MRRVLATITLLCAVPLAAARADTVLLRDGRVFEGLIKRESDREVTIETKVGKIRSTLTFKRSEIKKIEKAPLPDGFFDAPKPGSGGPAPEAAPSPPAKAPADSPAPAGDGALYLEIPIVGEFGEEVVAEGVEQALEQGLKRGVKHVVFVVDSPGGRVDDAQRIAAAIDRFRDQATFSAVVNNAFSASIWVTFSCHHIFMNPGASMGAAVAFSRDRSSGAAEVDAKFNSAIAATLSATAETLGHPPEIVRAMIIMDAELWSWNDDAGSVRFADKKPAKDAKDAKEVDSRRTVLTLTADEAVRLGVARPITGGADAVGPALGVSGWKKAGDLGAAAMKRAAAQQQKADAAREKEYKRIVDGIPEAIAYINDNAREAESLDPRRITVYYDKTSGMMTIESQRQWMQQTDSAVAAWRRVLDGLKRLHNLEKDAEKLGLERTVYDSSVKDFAMTADREIAWLLQNRRKNSL